MSYNYLVYAKENIWGIELYGNFLGAFSGDDLSYSEIVAKTKKYMMERNRLHAAIYGDKEPYFKDSVKIEVNPNGHVISYIVKI